MATLYTWSSSANTAPDVTVGTAPTIAAGGTYGERYNWAASTTSQNIQKTGLSVAGDFGSRTIYTIASAATSSHTILFFTDTAATPLSVAKVDLTATGLVRIRNTANATVDGTVALAYGVEHRFEVFRVAGTLTVKAYRVSDNALISNTSSAAGTVTGTLGRVGWGNNATLTGTLGAFTHDEMVVTDVGAEIGDAPRPLTATMVLSPTTGAAPLSVTSTVTAVGGTGTALSYAWAWGDTTSTPAQSSNVATHTYAAAGTYNPVCTVLNA